MLIARLENLRAQLEEARSWPQTPATEDYIRRLEEQFYTVEKELNG